MNKTTDTTAPAGAPVLRSIPDALYDLESHLARISAVIGMMGDLASDGFAYPPPEKRRFGSATISVRTADHFCAATRLCESLMEKLEDDLQRIVEAAEAADRTGEV